MMIIKSLLECIFSFSGTGAVAVLEITGPRAQGQNYLLGPCLKITKCFPVISFQFFLKLGAMAPLAPLKPPPHKSFATCNVEFNFSI